MSKKPWKAAYWPAIIQEIRNTNNAGDASITEFVSIFGEVLNQKSVHHNNVNKFLTRNKQKNSFCIIFFLRYRR